MMRSLFAGVSGLKVHQTKMDVIGNNISNVNTAGYKRSRVNFQEMLNQTLRGASAPQANRGGTNPTQIGLGVNLGSIDVIHTGGSPQSTGKALDMSIEGEGYFVVGDNTNTYYTRAGNFDFDDANNFVTTNGMKVKGWVATIDPTNGFNLDTSGSAQPINLNSLAESQIMQATSEVEIGRNLDSRDGIIPKKDVPYALSNYTSSTPYSSLKAATAGSEVTIDLGVGAIIDSNFEMRDQSSNIIDYATLTDPANLGNWDFDTATGVLTIINGGGAGGWLDSLVDGDTLEITHNTANHVSTYVDATISGSDLLAAAPSDSSTWAEIKLGTAAVFDSNFAIRDESGHYITYADLTTDAATMEKWNFDPSTGTLTIKDSTLFDGSQFTGQDFEAGDNIVVSYQEAQHTTPVTIFDSQGGAHELNVVYYKSDDNTWKTNIAIDGELVDTNYEHTIKFNSTGQIDPTTATLNITKVLGNGVEDLETTIDFNSLTQVAADTTALYLSQNGFEPGSLQSISVDTSGRIVGTFSNGQNLDLAQVALATFRNPAGLSKAGNTMFTESKNSGNAQIGTAGTAGRGVIKPETLEMSNVDLSQEFVDMITTQRGFQANSRIITTSDEMLQELVNLKR